MRRRFRRRPPLWLALAVVMAAALAARGWLSRPKPIAVLAPGIAVVSSVIDGRTLEVASQTGTQPIHVRLLGIEIIDDDAASDWLRSQLDAHTVRIELDKRRRATDGAQFAYVYLGPTLVNAELVRQGWATHAPYPDDSASHAKLMREAARK